MRITGGTLRSRSLKAPRGTTTRPTSDRVREAMFSMLASDGVFDGALDVRVLDLYAGTGALAFESLSRGAVSAVLVEEGREALAVLRDNTRALGLDAKARIVPGRVERVLDRIEGPFELVLCDPPYADVRSAGFAALVANVAARLADGGVFVLEHDASDAPPVCPDLVLDRSRTHGDTAVSLFRRVRA
jgi:16S rRNA (guanine966-N2)-methyltransferase